MLYHRPGELSAVSGVSAPTEPVRDELLIDRIVTAYGRANKAELGDSMWKAFFATYHEPVHRVLAEGGRPAVAAMLRNPAATDLFFGFDILTKSHNGVFRDAAVRKAYAKLCLDGLLRFAESAGAVPMDNPETWPARTAMQTDIGRILASLGAVGAGFSSPNPFPDEHGVASPVGVISYRVPQALYQAWRIKQLVRAFPHPRVLEIGAGLGRTAHCAYQLGIKNYTIVDIPVTAVAQAYFLGRTLGQEHVRLDGEPAGSGESNVRIIGPQTFLDENLRYDLIVNVDSLPEMDFAVAAAYWEKIKRSTPTFLSINHEANAFRVADVIASDRSRLSVERSHHWMRRGYAEELIRIQTIADRNSI